MQASRPNTIQDGTGGFSLYCTSASQREIPVEYGRGLAFVITKVIPYSSFLKQDNAGADVFHMLEIMTAYKHSGAIGLLELHQKFLQPNLA